MCENNFTCGVESPCFTASLSPTAWSPPSPGKMFVLRVFLEDNWSSSFEDFLKTRLIRWTVDCNAKGKVMIKIDLTKESDKQNEFKKGKVMSKMN